MVAYISDQASGPDMTCAIESFGAANTSHSLSSIFYGLNFQNNPVFS